MMVSRFVLPVLIKLFSILNVIESDLYQKHELDLNQNLTLETRVRFNFLKMICKFSQRK